MPPSMLSPIRAELAGVTSDGLAARITHVIVGCVKQIFGTGRGCQRQAFLPIFFEVLSL
jgi:hypothetical protein